MREPSEAKTIRNSIQREEILEKLHQASKAIELVIRSQIEFESLENSKSYFDIDDDIIFFDINDNMIDKALEEDPDFSKIQNLIQLSEGDSQANFLSKLNDERDYISNLDNLIEKNIAKSNFNQKIIKILSSDEDEFPEIASHNQGAKVRESVSQLEPSGAKGASPSSFEKDKQKLMEQPQLIINSLTQTNSTLENLDQLKLVSSAISECNTESKFREIEQGINPHISEFLKKLEKEIEKKTQHPEKVKKEAEVKAKREAEVKAKREAEVKAKRKAEVKAKRKAEVKAKKEAEEQAKREAEEQAKREAEEQAKLEAEAKAQKAVAKQQRRIEYIQKESIINILDQIVRDVTHGLATELAIEERSWLEEKYRIKSKTVADAVDKIENKIIDELLPEYVNKVVDGLLPEYINQVVDKLVNEVVNEAVEEIANESFANAETEEKAKIEAEERSRLKDQIRAEIESEVREEIEARLRGEIEARVREEIEARLRGEIEARVREELKVANKIDLERKLKELETNLQIKYEKLFDKKILEEREMHARKLEKISKVLKDELEDEIKEGPKRDENKPNPNDLFPLAQAPQLGLAVKKTDEAKISELNSAKQIQDFFDDNPEDKIKKLTREFYDENSHELIFKIITNAEITSSKKIQTLNIIKAITSEESWKEVINKRKEDLTLFETAILSGDSILAEYFISNYKKIDESNVCNAIYFLSLSDKIEKNNKLEILTKILDLTSEEELDEILNKKSNSNNTLLDYASKCDENFILKLTQKGARLRDCKKLHEFINYAFNSDNFGKFVDNAKKNGEENIYGTINSDCQNLFHHLSNNKFSLTSGQISEKFEKLYHAMDREQFLNSINQLDNNSSSPLDLAIKNNNTKFALELIEKGANKNYILHELYSAKNYDMMEVFYTEGLIKFTEFPEKIIETLLETIRNNTDRAGIDINDKFLNFIQENLATEKLKKVEKIAEEKLSQPSPTIQQKSSSSLGPQGQNLGLEN